MGNTGAQLGKQNTSWRSFFNVPQAGTLNLLLISRCGSPRQLHLSSSPGRTDPVLWGTLSHCPSHPVCGQAPRLPTRGQVPEKEGRCTESPAGGPGSTQCWGAWAEPRLHASSTPSVQ